jgi:hypothetical protein
VSEINDCLIGTVDLRRLPKTLLFGTDENHPDGRCYKSRSKLKRLLKGFGARVADIQMSHSILHIMLRDIWMFW